MSGEEPVTPAGPLVDAHVHAFPERLALAVRNHLQRNGRLLAGPLLDDVARQVRADGFDAAWVLPYAHRAGVANGANEWMAREASEYPWLVPGATFHPDDGDLAALVSRALDDLGLRVVKLHCSVGRFAPDDGRLAPLWETAARLGVPVVVHAGQESPGDTSAREIDALAPVLRRYPALRLVLAHAGHPDTGHALELMAEHGNLYADLTPVWDRPVAIGPEELARFPGRFLFGSDAPNNPAGAREQADRLRQLLAGSDELDAVMGGTALQLTGPAVVDSSGRTE